MTSETKGCAIEFVDVQYTVTYPDPEKSKMFDKVMATKTIIKGVTGKVEPGQALAIMGASGAGKTTLLNILAGRINGEGLQGEVRFDGKALKPKEISSIVGFVMQNDIFIEFLTVEETLQFAGKLKFKGDETERKKRIDALVGQLKLENARNTLVGGQFAKGISGGEKKRLNIAFELISDPPVIFMDEPTSGLDSYTSFLVVKLMGDIARRVQKTVIYTIHQPSSEIFQMFDQLLLIYRGKLIFQGNARDSVPYFRDELQLPCDVNSNPSDHFMYMMQVTNPLVESKMIQTYEKKIAPAIAAKINPPNNNEVKFDLRDFSPLLNQFGALFNRSVLATKRNPLLTFVKIAQNLIMGFIFCSIFFQLTTDPPGTNDTQNLFNKNGSLFFMTAFHFIPAMMAVIVTFPVQRLVFLKEYSGRFYSSFPYFMSKLVVELPLSILFPILWTCAIYYITDYYSPFVNLCKMALTAALMNVCANCLGLAIGAGFNDIDTALNVTPLIFFPLMLFCGFYANSDSIPKWVSWIEYISPFRYGLEALITNEFGGRGFNPDPVATLGYSLGYWNAILLMVALTVAYMLLAYIILATRARTLNN